MNHIRTPRSQPQPTAISNVKREILSRENKFKLNAIHCCSSQLVESVHLITQDSKVRQNHLHHLPRRLH